ncbi:hypothetical protein MED222_05570 [Vibrio sp. MED222]|nr:hypothetical protein MED222_05570 [Vibrio sp. MED222]
MNRSFVDFLGQRIVAIFLTSHSRA